MIIPNDKLLFRVVLCLPFTVLGVLVPATAWFLILILVIFFLIATIDAVRGFSYAESIEIIPPDIVRMSKNKQGDISLKIKFSRIIHTCLLIGLPLPDEFYSEHDALNVRIPTKSTISIINWSCTPHTRGNFFLNRCFFITQSPYGLWRIRSSSVCKTEIRVYPDMSMERKKLAALFLRRKNQGFHRQRLVGQGRDFEKLREYIPGDNFEDIHWKATAKRCRPITKLYQIERTQEIYIAIDSSRLSGKPAGSSSSLEQFITSALTLGVVAEQQGDLFGVITFNSKVQHFIRAGKGRNHYNSCRDSLFALNTSMLNPDFGELSAFIRLKLRRRALIIILTDIVDPILAENFTRNINILSKQHIIMVSIIKHPGIEPLFTNPNVDTIDKIYENLGGHIMWHKLQELNKTLQHKGIRLSLSNVNKLSINLVTQYMSIKARQIL